jgi:hypothetical protein
LAARGGHRLVALPRSVQKAATLRVHPSATASTAAAVDLRLGRGEHLFPLRQEPLIEGEQFRVVRAGRELRAGLLDFAGATEDVLAPVRPEGFLEGLPFLHRALGLLPGDRARLHPAGELVTEPRLFTATDPDATPAARLPAASTWSRSPRR